jgi:hypothetical protein
MTFSRWFQRIHIEHVLLGGPFVVILIASALYTLGLALSGSPNIRGVEQNVVFTVQQVMIDAPLYPNPNAPPFAITQYSPLYYIVVAEVANLFGIIPGDQVAQVYVVGRLLSWSMALLITMLVFLVARLYGARNILSIAVAATTLTITIPWYSLIRPDAMMALWGVATVALYSGFLLNPNHRYATLMLVVCGCVGFLAFLSKQNGAIFLVPVGIFALLRLQIREMIFLGVGVISSALLTSLVFNSYYSLIPSDTNFIYQHIIDGVDNGISLRSAYLKLYSIYITQFLPFIAFPLAAIIYLALNLWSKEWRQLDTTVLFFALATGIITVAYMISGLKIGSAIHYANEPMIIAMLFLVRFITVNPLPRSAVEHTLVKIAAATFWICFLGAALITSFALYMDEIPVNAHEQYEIDTIVFLESAVKEQPDIYIYSSSRRVNNVLFDQIIIPHPDIARLNHFRGLVNYSLIGELLETGKLAYIVVETGEPLPEYIYANPVDNSAFRLVKQGDDLDVYFNERTARTSTID